MNNEFLMMIKQLIPDRYEEFLESLKKPFHKGFRINSLKISDEDFFNFFDIQKSPSVYAKNAYLLLDDKSYGNTIMHKMGLMYLQEVSAASVVDLLDIKENDTVLDMCSAPGGKATQIAQRLNNTGLLVANEIENNRAIKLLSNIERWGINNCIILNDEPANIANTLYGFFDKILVDAPCSGEGMFRKNDEAILDWSMEHVNSCHHRQIKIQEEAYKCLKDNGTLVYSTCTLNIIENEKVIEEFVLNHPDIELVKIDVDWGMPGFKTTIDTTKCRRLMPFHDTEGHFMAKMIKHHETKTVKLNILNSKIDSNAYDFIKDNYKDMPKYLYQKNDKVYGGNNPFYDLKKLHIIRNQVLLGEMIKKRFEPHQHFYTSVGFKNIQSNNFKKYIELTSDEVISFYQGNTLSISGYKGYVGLSYKNIIIGYGKGDNNIIKNKYPKGLRLL